MFSAEIRDSALSRRNAVLDGAAEHNRTLNIDAVKFTPIFRVNDVNECPSRRSSGSVTFTASFTSTTSTPSGGEVSWSASARSAWPAH